MPLPAIRPVLLGLVIAASAVAQDADRPSTTFREGFEGPKPSWRREETDATVKILAHERTALASHEGKSSERFEFTAGPGSVLYYSLNVPNVAIDDETRATLFVRSSRSGIQLYGRVVLPRDLDPDTGRPSFVLVAGTSTATADRWQKVELSNMRAALEREVRVLRIGSGRKVPIEGAYLERLVVNLYSGAGGTEVFLDDLSLSPVPVDKGPEVAEEKLPELPPTRDGRPGRSPDSGRVQLVRNQLLKDGYDWVPTIIHAPGADPAILRQNGFDVLALDADDPPAVAQAAIKAGLMLMPTLNAGPGIDPGVVVGQAATYPEKDYVAMWSLGDDLGTNRDLSARKVALERHRRIVAGLHDLPAGTSRLVTGTVGGFVPQYALAGRSLDLLGVEAPDLATAREPIDTYRFLEQRRNLAIPKNPRIPMLAWIPASAPPAIAENVWGADPPPTWGQPEILPEQIRMYTYTALAAGYRAIGFRGGEDLTRPEGEPRLIEMALLNAEIDLVESVLARGADTIPFGPAFPPDPEIPMVFNPLGTSGGISSAGKNTSQQMPTLKETPAHPSIRVASLPTSDNRGRLLMVMDLPSQGQYVPGQMAINNLKLMVQGLESSQAFEITPAGLNVLKRDRTTGGMRFTLPVFNVTALVLVTTDLSVKDRLEADIARIAPMACELAIRQARASFELTRQINARLVLDGHSVRDSDDLLAQADEVIKAAGDAKDRMDYPWPGPRRNEPAGPSACCVGTSSCRGGSASSPRPDNSARRPALRPRR